VEPALKARIDRLVFGVRFQIGHRSCSFFRVDTSPPFADDSFCLFCSIFQMGLVFRTAANLAPGELGSGEPRAPRHAYVVSCVFDLIELDGHQPGIERSVFLRQPLAPGRAFLVSIRLRSRFVLGAPLKGWRGQRYKFVHPSCQSELDGIGVICRLAIQLYCAQ